MASPSLIAVSNNFDYSGSAATVTATEPTGTTSGDILIVNLVLANAATAIAQPLAWGLEGYDWGLISQRTASSTYTRATWWVRRGSSALDLVLRWTSAQNWEWSISCWRGCSTVGSPVESLALNSVSTTGARPDPAAVTTASVDTTVVVVCSAWRGHVAPCGAISGYTTVFSGAGGYAHSSQYLAVSGSGTNENPGQPTNAATGDDANEALTFVLRSVDPTVPTTRPYRVGTPAYGSTSVAVPYPAVSAGDCVLMFVGTKPDTATITNPNGAVWTLVDETSGGGGTTGADAGPTKLACFRLTADATGSESGTVSVSITSGNSSWGFMVTVRNSGGGGFSVAGDGGTDSTTGAAVSVTIGSDIGLQADDIVIGAMCLPTDVNMPGNKVGVYGVTATGVSSWDSFGEAIEVASTTNNDIGGFAFHGRVIAGTSSAAAVATATATGTTTNVRGPLVLVRVRGLAGGTSITPPLLSASASLLGPALAIALAAPLLSASVALLAPTVSQGQTLTPPLLSASTTLHDPAVSVALQAPLLTAPGALLDPSVQQAQPPYNVLPGPVLPGEFNRRLPPFWPPSEIPRSTVALAQLIQLTPPLLSASTALHAPRIDVALSAPSVAAAPTLPTPSVAVAAQAPLVSAAPALLVPGVSVTLSAPLVTSSPSLLAPTVQQSVTPPLLSATSVLVEPSLGVAVQPPVMSASAALLAPAVSQAGTVAPPVLVAGSAVLTPAVSVSLAAPVLSGATALSPPTVSAALAAPLLSAAPTVLAPAVAVDLRPPVLAGSSSLLLPGAVIQLAPPMLSAAAALLAPIIDQGPPGEVRPPLLTAASQLLAPGLSVDLQAALLIANSQLLSPTVRLDENNPETRPVRLRASFPTGPIPLRSLSRSGPIKVR